jgi:hypothetical protein
MPDRPNDPLPKAPELNETVEAIARGRELVKQAQRLGEEADRQNEGVQATIKEADRVLDRSHELLRETPAGRQPSRGKVSSGSASDEEV